FLFRLLPAQYPWAGGPPLSSSKIWDAAFNGPGPQISAYSASTYDKTIAFIQTHKDEPFFIHVAMHEPHTPHFPKPQFVKQFKHLEERQRVYAAVLAEADHGVGRILQTLDELDLAENTLVVFTSDNRPEATGRKKKQPPTILKNGVRSLGTYYSVPLRASLS
ncbi:MAG: arylsulfatase A-like enzyme, partial [Rhodothermales bacterium]